MIYYQFVDGHLEKTETSHGADFLAAIKCTQSSSKTYSENRKVPQTQRLEILDNFLKLFFATREALSSLLQDDLGYSLWEASQEIEDAYKTLCALHSQKKTQDLLNPLGVCFIYGSISSPVLRVAKTIASALITGNSVIVLTSQRSSQIYTFLSELYVKANLPSGQFNVISSDIKDVHETLLTHPSVRAIHWQSHFYEGEFLRSLKRDLQKKVKVFFGGRNPVIWTHDAPLVVLKDALKTSLSYHFRGETRFHQWFVQEKNYFSFIENVQILLKDLSSHDFGVCKDERYQLAFDAQLKSIKKEKNWLNSTSSENSQVLPLQINLDFNNCSPWQQTEVLGPTLTITRYKNSSEAIKFVNTTYYASAAIVFSSSHEKSLEIAQSLNMPQVLLNTLPKEEIDSPTFGSFESGYGNELSDFDFFTHQKIIL